VFLARLRFASDLGQRVTDALLLPDPKEAVERLAAIEREVLAEEQVVSHLHTGLMGIYLGYREKGAYQRMVDLYPRLPPELRSTPVAREQRALALNRLAESEEKRGDRVTAKGHRDLAFAAIEGLPEALRSSETYGILGRIYKGWSDAEARAGNAEHAQALLKQAIETYEAGFRADPRDYYPGVNAVTLRIRRDSDDDRRILPQLVPVVRFAVERAPRPDKDPERYWQTATKLELACAERDWPAAEAHLADILPIRVQGWMRTTTIDNLDLQRKARADEGETVTRLTRIIGALQPAAP
jgi:tetratricopeptide (TPR) repeat protein